MKKLLRIIFITLVSSFVLTKSYSQCNFVLVNSVTNNFTVNNSSLVPCLNQATYTVNIENVSPFTLSNIQVAIQFPQGINYIAGSSNNATETNIADLNNPTFSLANINASTTSNNTLSFSINIDANCQVQQFLDAGGIVQNELTITNDASNNGNNISCNISHTSPIYSASVPNLAIVNIDPQSHAGSVGDNLDRCISIINGGTGGLSQFSLHDTHGTGIVINGTNLGTITTNGSTKEILLTGADFVTIGNMDNVFDPGETIEICEQISVVSCEATSSQYKYFWGCNNQICQELTDGANVTFPGEIPNVEMIRNNSFRTINSDWNNSPITTDRLCFTSSPYTSSITIRNTGTGTAYDFLAKINTYHSSSATGFDVSNIQMQRRMIGQSAQDLPFNRDSLINPTRYGSGWSSCLPPESVGNIDFIIDSIQPNEEYVITWEWFSCFDHKDCSNRQHMYLWYYQGDYKNKCGQDYEVLRTGGSYWIYYDHNFTLDNSPGTIFGANTSTIRYVNNRWRHWIPRNDSNDLFRFEIILPPCLVYEPNSFVITRTDGVEILPDNVSFSGDTINIFYEDLPHGALTNVGVPQEGIYNESNMEYQVTLDCNNCSGGGVYPIQVNSYYNPNTNPVQACDIDNELLMGCNSFDMNIVCPNYCPGIQFNRHHTQRTNLGLPDNDNNGLPDVGGALDYTRIRQDRMVYGDNLEILHGGDINNTLNDSVWPYVIATTEISQAGHLLTYQNAEFTLYSTVSGGYHTANVPNSMATITDPTADSKHIKFNLDLNALTFTPALPSGSYSLQHNDSVFLKSNYKVTKNIGGWGNVVANTYSRYFCSDLPDPATLDNQFGCPELIQNFTIYGFNFDMHGYNSYRATSCSPLSLRQAYYLQVGGGTTGKNKFTNEYRKFAHPRNLKIILQDSYTYEKASFYFARTRGFATSSAHLGEGFIGGPHASGGGWYEITPSSIVGNEYTFNTDVYFGDDPANDSIIYGDEGFYGELSVQVSPNCSVEGDTSKPVKYEWEFDIVESIQGTTNNPDASPTGSNRWWDDTIVSVRNDLLFYDKPKLFLQSNLVSQNVPGNTAVWELSITNNSNVSVAHNSWFSMPTTGSIVADSMFDPTRNTMVFPNADGIFEVDTIGASGTQSYMLYTHINSCNTDSIDVFFGWDCRGYPQSVEDYENYPCETLKTKLYITPLMPEIANNVFVQEDTIGLCDTAKFEIEVIDFQLGNIYNLFTTINIPDGMTIEPGSCFLRYPENGANINIPEPVNTVGSNYEWDIDTLNDAIRINGLMGVLDQTQNKYYISFNCITSCDYVSGSRITSITRGEARCGQAFQSNVGLSDQVFISDALPPYEANIQIQTSYITPCFNSAPIELIVVNNGPQSFGTTDSIYFKLDEGLNYDANSFAGITNPPVNGVPSIYNNNGIEELAWKLPQGVGVGDTTRFSFTINGNTEDLPCEGVLQLTSQITTFGSAVCSVTGELCNISIATADTLKNIFIYKGYLEFSNAENSYATPNAPNGELGHITFDIFNSGETISQGTQTIIQYYQDTDNDGVHSNTDIYITNDTIYDELTSNSTYNYSSNINIPAGLSCRIIAVLDTSINPCSCSPTEILINLDLESPSSSHTICSQDMLTIGNEHINGYTYSWSPSTNLNNDTIAEPNFYIDLNYPATNTFQFVRTIDRGFCSGVDTVNVLVYSRPISVAGTDQGLCNVYNTTLEANQPEGTAAGQWNMISAPHLNSATFVDSHISNTGFINMREGRYVLEWVVSNGVCEVAKDTVIINVYDEPMANAGDDRVICEQFSTILEGNQPQGTATGVWTNDIAFGNPTNVIFYNDTNYNATASNFQEGEYQLIWTVSNGVCPAAIDTVRLSSYKLPTAEFSISNRVCLDECATAINSSFVQNPYFITEYQWLVNGALQQSTQDFQEYICFQDTGIHDLKLLVVTNKGCKDTSDAQTSILVTETPDAGFSYAPAYGIKEFLAIQITDESVGATSIIYDFGDGTYSDSINPYHWYNYSGDYEIMQVVENKHGCNDTAIKEIEVGVSESIFIPNSFTPNGDGINDVFYPLSRGVDSHEYRFYVFNRWGQLIFTSHDPLRGWDGTHKGVKAKTDVYVWRVIYYSREEEKKITKRGHINLLR